MKVNKKKALVGGLLAATLATTGIFAYFTDSDSATNTFTVGNVTIDLTEPNWDGADDTNGNNIPDYAENLTPLKTVVKDPTVENTGVNDAYVFVEVTVPKAEVAVADVNGAVGPKQKQELFTLGTPNAGWAELTGAKVETEDAVTHVFVYGTADTATVLAAGAKTPAVFNDVTFVNLVESEDLAGDQLEIDVVAKAIQSDNLNGGIVNPTEILNVYNNQNQ